MFATLMPLFDQNLQVAAYSIFAQKENFLLNPELLGVAGLDGIGRIDGLEVVEKMGIETWEDHVNIFIPVTNISIFADIAAQCSAPHERLVLLMDPGVTPEPSYIARLTELKEMGYKLAIRKLTAQKYIAYDKVLRLMDYILLNYRKTDIEKAKRFFQQVYPHIKICACNIKTMPSYEKLKEKKCSDMYEGDFFRIPVTKGDNKVEPLKVNYIELLNLVNGEEFELKDAAKIIGKDTALVISLLKMVNRMTVNSEIKSIRHATAMLGQEELKKWINTALANELYADKPSEITRFSLLRAKFAENLAGAFKLDDDASELFLMGLFSVLDVILDKPMNEALEIVKVSDDIKAALISQSGVLASVLEFIRQYERANWQEVSRLMILLDIGIDQVYDAYIQALEWCHDLLRGTV